MASFSEGLKEVLQMSEFVLTGEAGEILELASTTVIHYEKTGKLPAIRTARGVRLFKRSDVESFKAERQAKRTTQPRRRVRVESAKNQKAQPGSGLPGTSREEDPPNDSAN